MISDALVYVPLTRPTRAATIIIAFFDIMNVFSSPLVVFQKTHVCIIAGKARPSADRHKAPKSEMNNSRLGIYFFREKNLRRLDKMSTYFRINHWIFSVLKKRSHIASHLTNFCGTAGRGIYMKMWRYLWILTYCDGQKKCGKHQQSSRDVFPKTGIIGEPFRQIFIPSDINCNIAC